MFRCLSGGKRRFEIRDLRFEIGQETRSERSIRQVILRLNGSCDLYGSQEIVRPPDSRNLTTDNTDGTDGIRKSRIPMLESECLVGVLIDDSKPVPLKGLATGWPIGQSVASRMASPICNPNKALSIFTSDWTDWPAELPQIGLTGIALSP